MARKPAHLSCERSLGLLPFVYARSALEGAGFAAGERVLIHVAGQASLAAIQVVRHLSGEVFAAVSSNEDAELAKALGAQHVVSACPADLCDELLDLTGGEGVHVVFGTEVGEMLTKSFAALAAGGRYIHFSESESSEVIAPPISASESRSFAVFQPYAARVSWAGHFRKTWADIWFHAAAFKPAERHQYSIPALREAFAEAQEHGHTRRFNVTLTDDVQIDRLPVPARKSLFDPNAWYLITGGFGGLALEIAQWMLQEQARHLILVSRKGAVTTEAHAALAAMRRQGADIWEAAADVTDRKQIDSLFAQIDSQALPLRGILHTAAVFDDIPIRDLNPRRWQDVLWPKALGAYHLHENTRRHHLDFFVVFSSISAQVGSPGQASYAAANAYLDAFAHWRRSQGLPATSVNWGAIGGVGILSRSKMVEEYLQRVGNRPLTPKQCSQMLGRVIRANPTQVTVVDVDWRQWAQFHPAWERSERFKHLIEAEEQGDSAAGAAFARRLRQLEPTAAVESLSETVKQWTAQTMQLPVAAIDSQQSLVNLGLDSLIAMELQVVIERETDVKVSTLELMKGTTILQLSESLLKRILEKQPSVEVVDVKPESFTVANVTDPMNNIDSVDSLSQLSSEQLNALLSHLSQPESGQGAQQI